MIDELAMHTGDVLVLDVPNAESLRLSARAVRELAGESLLGICVFRLPTVEDPATLTIAQVAAALSDCDSRAEVDTWILTVKNVGTASAMIETVKVDLLITPGTTESLTTHESASVEYLCTAAGAANLINLEPCSQRRANVIRFKPRTLMSGQSLMARLAMNLNSSTVIPVLIEMQTDTGQQYLDRREVAVESKVQP